MSDLSRFRGRRGAIWRELGEEQGGLVIWERLNLVPWAGDFRWPGEESRE